MDQIFTGEIVCSKIDAKKSKWRVFKGFDGLKLSGPFYMTLFTDNEIEIGYDKNAAVSHSMIICPGSHIAPMPEGGDWMVKFYLSPEKAMTKDALTDAVKNLRRKVAKRILEH